MKRQFPGFFGLSVAQEDAVWKAGIIAFDTNVLNNLYRGDLDIFQKFEQLVSKVEGRVWIPYQVGAELASSLAREHKALKDYSTKLNKTITDAENQLTSAIEKERPEFFKDDALTTAVNRAFLGIHAEAKATLGRVDLEGHLKTVDQYLMRLLDGKLSPALSTEEFLAACQCAQQRYDLKIPPGYEDADKSTGNAYGDYLIWRALLEKCSSDDAKHCIFVTDDQKKDWWKNYADGTPHPRLPQEFFESTGMHYLQYPMAKFLAEVARRFKLRAPSREMTERIDALSLRGSGLASRAEKALYDELSDIAPSVGWTWLFGARFNRHTFDLFEPNVKLAVEIEGTMWTRSTEERLKRRNRMSRDAQSRGIEIVFVGWDDVVESRAFGPIYSAYIRRREELGISP